MNIKLSIPHLGGNEAEYTNQAITSGWITPLGPFVNKFEQSIAEYIKVDENNVGVFASGTASIHLALLLLGVKLGDEVLCSSFTFSASANPISYCGATPIFIDSERDTWNMCPVLLEKAIKDRINQKKIPKAIILVHLYGMAAQLKEIMQISKKYNIPVIEDAAEALGSKYDNQDLGTFGDYGVYSFNGNKIITTSGGGSLYCENLEDKKKAIFYATQAKEKYDYYHHEKIGYNYRLSNVSAAIGVAQMEVLEERVRKRRTNFDYYKLRLNGLVSFQENQNNSYSNRWLTCIILKDFETREKVKTTLLNKGIEVRPLWKPMHLQPVFKNTVCYINEVSEDLFNRGLCLPSGSHLEENDLEIIVKNLLAIL